MCCICAVHAWCADHPSSAQPHQTAPATSTASPRATTTTAPSGCRPRASSTTATVAAPTRTATTASSKQWTFCRDALLATVAVISDLCYRLWGRDLCGLPSLHHPQSHTRTCATQLSTYSPLLNQRNHDDSLEKSGLSLSSSVTLSAAVAPHARRCNAFRPLVLFRPRCARNVCGCPQWHAAGASIQMRLDKPVPGWSFSAPAPNSRCSGGTSHVCTSENHGQPARQMDKFTRKITPRPPTLKMSNHTRGIRALASSFAC